MTQQYCFWVSTQEIWKHFFAKIWAPICSSQYYYGDQDIQTTDSPSIGEWVGKMWYVYTMEYSSPTEKTK